jgi:hypothetical protein
LKKEVRFGARWEWSVPVGPAPKVAEVQGPQQRRMLPERWQVHSAGKPATRSVMIQENGLRH